MRLSVDGQRYHRGDYFYHFVSAISKILLAVCVNWKKHPTWFTYFCLHQPRGKKYRNDLILSTKRNRKKTNYRLPRITMLAGLISFPVKKDSTFSIAIIRPFMVASDVIPAL